MQTVHTNFHAKSGLCGARNERVMLNFAIWRPFCFLAAILFFIFFQNLFGLSIQNLDSVAQDERVLLNFAIWRPFYFLAAILFFKKKSKFGQTVHTNFHAKSGLYSSRNEQVMLNFVIWRPFCFARKNQNLF